MRAREFWRCGSDVQGGFVALNGIFRFVEDGTNQRGLAVYEIGDRTLNVVDPGPEQFTDLTN